MEMIDERLRFARAMGLPNTSQTDKPQIIIVDGQRIFREAVGFLLSAEPEFGIIGETTDGHSFIQRMEELKPDLVLMTSSELEINKFAIDEIKRRSPATKVLVLTTILDLLKSGADGFLPMEATHGELVFAIRKVLAGERYLSPAISEKVLTPWTKGKKTLKKKSSWESLTRRERQVLKLIAEGNTNKKIASCLGISPSTADKHRSNLMGKIDAHNIPALTIFAINNGLIKVKQGRGYEKRRGN